MTNIQPTLDHMTAEASRGDIVFPTHAGIALQVQRMLDNPDCAVDALGKLVSAET